MKRAMRKHSKNMIGWSKTIMNVKDQRDLKQQNPRIKIPNISLIELQDLHKQDHLPHELHEHIENEMNSIEKSLESARNS